MNATFGSLQTFNYRMWAGGAFVSNVGTWMQRTAQDWIVLTQLTHHNATAVGVVMGLQFGPQILLLPLTGFAADHLDRRKLLICTQAAMGLLALGLRRPKSAFACSRTTIFHAERCASSRGLFVAFGMIRPAIPS